MDDHEKELHFTVVYRGRPLQLKALAGSTLGDLGKEIVDLTGVAPHTLRLILPKRPPLQPMSERHSPQLLYQSAITEGLRMTMMGSSTAEVAAVSQPLKSDRIIGFSEEEQRARQRSGYATGSYTLPKGNYIFCDFQTLRLPGIELNPPPAMALKIMHKLASDRGIIAIMNKNRWRVGIMTEMAPIGYVGVSPKCILGFNKNRGQEISLRLRTDDLKGFRKYESIKKTLLHELAHMVHDEHDEKFHALDKKLNEEAIALDWTKSQGHSLSGAKFEDEDEEMTSSSSGSSRGYKLGGRTEQFVDARTAAAAAALRRLGDASKTSQGESSQSTVPNSLGSVSKTGVQSEPNTDEQGSQAVVVVASGMFRNEDAGADDITVCVPVRNQEPYPDEAPHEHAGHNEPDPGEAMDIVTDAPARTEEPDPDEAVDIVFDTQVLRQEPDPDESSSGHSRRNEPDPDAAVDIVLDAPVSNQEPGPDEASGGHYSRNERGPDETSGSLSSRNEPDPDAAVDILLDAPVKKQEPDPDEVSGSLSCRNEPDPDAAVDIVLDTLERQEPDPDEVAEADGVLDGCVCCRRMACKGMKSSTGGDFTELAKPQMSR